MKKLITILTLSLSTSVCFAQPPNDDCAGATMLTPSVSCVNTAGTLSLATPSAVASCGIGSPNQDVWYSFVSTSTLHTVTVASGENLVIEVFSGSCGGTSMGCTNNNAGAGAETVSLVTIPSTTYWIRIYEFTGSITGSGGFAVCVSTPPVNDDCGGAVALTTYGNVCGGATTGSVNGATQYMVATCSGNANDDVWYTFVAGASNTNIEIVSSVSMDGVVETFSGACGSLTSLGCTNATGAGGTEILTLTGLIPSVTYYIRVYDSNSGYPSTTTFTICVTTPSSPPSNDDCSGAINIIPSASCGSALTGYDYLATQSLPATCGGTADDDVWYTFVATGTNHTITVTPSASFDAVLEIFSGTCGALTSLGCTNLTGAGVPETGAFTGLTIGTQYWIRVYDAGTGYPATSTFTICLLIPPPVNDDCTGAISLSPSPTCIPVTGDVIGATQSMPGCVGTANDDVWYTFTTNSTAGQPYTITVTPSASFDAVFQVFSGICGSLTSLTCVNYSNTTGVTEAAILSTLNASTQYWIRVYDASSAVYPATTTFDICISTSSLTATAVATPASCNTFCDGTATGTATGGVGPYGYAWAGPASYTGTGANITALCSGTYTLTITDSSNMATATATSFVSQPLLLTATLPPSYSVCMGSCVTLTGTFAGGTMPYTYMWSPATGLSSAAMMNPVACPAVSTTYTVTISDGNGCTATASTSVIVSSPLPAPYIGVDDTIPCGTTTYTLYSTTVAGAISYQWTPGLGGTIISGQGTTSITVSLVATSGTSSNIGIYSCTVTDAMGCVSLSDSMNLTLNAGGVANFTMVADSTTANNFWAFNSSTGASLSYSWDFGDATFSTLASPTHLYATSGVYYPCLTVTDGVCPASTYCDSALATGSVSPCNALFNVANNTSTPYPNDFILTNLSYGSPLTYFWDFGDIIGMSTAQNPTYTYASIGPYQICLMVDNGMGCNVTYCDSIDGVDSLGHLPNQPIMITVVDGPDFGTTVGAQELGIMNYELEIYPNPTERELRISDFGFRIESIKITNVLGQTVYQSAITTSQSEINVDVSALTKGVYFVRVNNTINKKFVKQ